MSGPSYLAAGVVAAKVHDYLITHQQAARAAGVMDGTPIPDVQVIEHVIDVAFWASLRHEEGYVPRVSLVIMAPEDASQPLVFEQALPLTVGDVVHVSPAVDRPGLHVAVWHVPDGQMRIWGTVRAVPTSCCVVEVAAPGLLVLKHRPTAQSGKFVNIAVLEGDQIKVIDERATVAADCPGLVASLVSVDMSSSPASVNPLVELAVSMRAHGRGGSLLVVPGDSDAWRDSLVHPMPYAVRPRFTELADLLGVPSRERPDPWEAAFRRAIDTIAGLTAVDGATVVTEQYALVAFGAKISRRDGYARVEQVALTEPIEGAVAEIVHPVQLGGTRHLSAAQFVQDQRDALALVASQDRHFTVFAWSGSDGLVHAHRIESLLL